MKLFFNCKKSLSFQIKTKLHTVPFFSEKGVTRVFSCKLFHYNSLYSNGN